MVIKAEALVQDKVKTYLYSLAATFYEEDIKKLIYRYDNCLNRQGDNV